MKKIIVIGHENSDTDSICAAAAMAELLRAEGKEAMARRKGNLNKEAEYALAFSGAEDKILELEKELPVEEHVFFFVDFNERAQSPIQSEKIELVGLIDHHKLGSDFKTEEPAYFRIEPLGSSSTLVAKLYFEKGVEIQDWVAKLLLAGIISDTLNLTSPTTTEEDRLWVKRLSELVGTTPAELAENLFEAKSDLSAFSPKEIAKLDYKNFDFGGTKVGIGVVETVKPEKVKALEEELKKALSEIKKEEGVDLIYLGIVDIINNRTEMLLVGEAEKALLMKVFADIVIEGENLILRGVVSRKKQIAPMIEKGLK